MVKAYQPHFFLLRVPPEAALHNPVTAAISSRVILHWPIWSARREEQEAFPAEWTGRGRGLLRRRVLAEHAVAVEAARRAHVERGREVARGGELVGAEACGEVNTYMCAVSNKRVHRARA